MELLKACRVCLNTDVRLYNMDKFCLNSTYEDLCGKNLDFEILSMVCAYCAALLAKFSWFKQKAKQSEIILQVMFTEHAEITTERIRKMNEGKSNMALPYNLQIIHNFNSDIEIKEENHESHNYINYNDDIYTDLNDSDNEPLSKITKTKKKCKKKDKIKNNTIKTEENFFNIDAKEIDTNVESLKLANSNVESQKLANTYVEPEIVTISNVESDIANRYVDSDVGIDTDMSDANIELILLTKEEQLAEILARKNSSNYQNSVYKCEYCFKGFMTEGTFKNHMVRHDPSVGPLSCSICKARCADARSMRAHALTHARRYNCRLCGHSAGTRHKASEHLQWHKGFRFICKLCGAKFSKSTTHLTHMRLRHDSGAVCDACGESFLGQSGLKMHKKKAHRFENGEAIVYADCVCGAKFRSEAALKIHRDSAQNTICDKELRHCEFCGESFQEVMFKDHLLIHSKENSLKTCSECSRTFASERALGLHHSRAHNANRANTQRAICEICGYTCISRSSLVYHQRTHTGERPFACSLCPKRFSIYQRLQIHTRTHTGERPFKCPHCPKAFKHKAALNRHDRVHSGARPYSCSTCGKSFTQSNSMKQHATSVHLRAPLYARKPKHSAVNEEIECQ